MTSEELREKYKTKDKVLIIGFAESWKKAPVKDESFDVWGLNSLFELIPGHSDLWFEIHDIDAYGVRSNQEIGYGLTREGKPYLEALMKMKRRDGSPCPVLMVKQYEDLVNSVRYPFEEIVEKYGNYFTNSVSYEIALAIDWGYKEIHVYGVDMATSAPFQNSEYGQQRPSCEYFLGIAIGKGIKVVIPPEADLLKAEFMYGYEDEKKLSFIAKMESLIKGMEDRKGAALMNQAGAQRANDQLVGRMEQMKLQKEWPEFANGGASKLDEEIAKYNVEWTKNIEQLQLSTKQADQYIGAIEALREAIKIRMLFK